MGKKKRKKKERESVCVCEWLSKWVDEWEKKGEKAYIVEVRENPINQNETKN